MKIIKIVVFVTHNHRKIDYVITCENGTKEFYNEQTVPHSIIHLMNARRSKTRIEYNYGQDYYIEYEF